MSATNTKPESKSLMAILGRALIDPTFRGALTKDRKAVANEYQLPPADRDALDKLDIAKLEEASKNLAGRADLTIQVVISGTFDAK